LGWLGAPTLNVGAAATSSSGMISAVALGYPFYSGICIHILRRLWCGYFFVFHFFSAASIANKTSPSNSASRLIRTAERQEEEVALFAPTAPGNEVIAPFVVNARCQALEILGMP
jgi:hypothetical protein